MIIEMKKIGTILNSRPAGREAFLRIVQIINGSNLNEKIQLDFSSVDILTPSFADEMLRLLKEKYPGRVEIVHLTSPAAKETLESIGYPI